MVDVLLRVLPVGVELVVSLAAVPSVGCWIDLGDGGQVAVDLVVHKSGGAVLVVGHPVGERLAAERLNAPVVEPEPAFELKG